MPRKPSLLRDILILLALVLVTGGLAFGGGEELVHLLGGRLSENQGGSVDAGDTKARETHAKIQETLEKAKTVQVKFSTLIKPARSRDFKGEGTLLLKEGDRGTLSWTFQNPGGEHKLRLVSDGSQMTYSYEGGRWPKIVHEETPRPLINEMGFIRFGPFDGVQYAGFWSNYPKGGQLDRSVRTSYRLTDFNLSESADGRGVLTYTISDYGGDPSKVKLSYELKSFRPIKREILRKFLSPSCGGQVIETESFEEFAMDAVIPDERFTLPAEKPDPAVYSATDIGQPKGLELKSARDIRLVGWLERGVLEYEGPGELEDVFQDYLAGMKQREWTIVGERLGDTKGVATMRRYTRTCSVEFTRVRDRVQATLKVVDESK